MVGYLCKIAAVSKSGYYRYWSSTSINLRHPKEQHDEAVKHTITQAFHFKKRKRGARSIKMILERQFQVVYNLKSQRAYLSTIKDGSTNEILAYHVSERITMDLATETLLKLKKKRSFKKTSEALIHSDQETHYTHPDFQKMVNYMGFKQSMSRRGNCWDNAPQESFFGHLKDEVSLKHVPPWTKLNEKSSRI